MRREPLDRETIIDAAMALADRDGLDRLTMRALGSELGVEAPSLYKHVQGKEDILDGLTDRVYAAIEVGGRDQPWPDRVRRYATALRRALLDHPNLAPLVATRPIFSTTTLTVLENALGELVAIGLDQPRSVYTVDVLVSFVTGHVLSELAAFEAGLDPAILAKTRHMLPEDQYRLVREALGSSPVNRDEEFAFGVELIIDGLHRLLAES